MAATEADWDQVVLNGGPPCFHLEGRRFCLRARDWFGHGAIRGSDHKYVSLVDLLDPLLAGRITPHEATAPTEAKEDTFTVEGFLKNG